MVGMTGRVIRNILMYRSNSIFTSIYRQVTLPVTCLFFHGTHHA